MPLILSPTQVGFNAREDGKFNRTFPEQAVFFKNKLNMPTEHYQDVLAAGHDRAFMVAGAMKADLLTDLKSAVDKVIRDGKSFGAFQKDFEAIVQKHGWEGWTGSDPQAGRDWRARVIYQTNLSTSYSAGRYQQMMDPGVLAALPYWKYLHNDSVHHPRPLHVEWNSTVLPHDDPWWDVHFAPNGYGCRCRIIPVDATEYEGKPAPDNGTYTFVDKQGVSHQVPMGIDYGFGYTPGKSVAQQDVPLREMMQTKLAGYEPPIGKGLAQAVNAYLADEKKGSAMATQVLAHSETDKAPAWGGLVAEPARLQRVTGIDTKGFAILLPAAAIRHSATHGATATDFDQVAHVINTGELSQSIDEAAFVAVLALGDAVLHGEFTVDTALQAVLLKSLLSHKP